MSMLLCKGAVVGVVVLATVIAMLVDVSQGQALVPAVIIFGDSAMDVGNNNHLPSLVKANFPPYGRDFTHHRPTGRFCNGKLASDFTVENLGFDSYPPAYLSKEATGSHLLNGTNFASAASGYLDSTSKLYSAISLGQQLNYYREYQEKVTKIVGKNNASDIFSGALYLVSDGSSDYIQNYYINPLLYKLFTPDQFADLLLHSFTSFIESLYKLGARRIGVTSLPPLGCLPAAVTLFGEGKNQCVKRLNNDAMLFNKKINDTAKSLTKKHSDLKLVIFDIYSPLLDLIKHPVKVSLRRGRHAVVQGRLRRHCCAMSMHWEHAQTPPVMCSGIVSTPLRPPISSYLIISYLRALISFPNGCLIAQACLYMSGYVSLFCDTKMSTEALCGLMFNHSYLVK